MFVHLSGSGVRYWASHSGGAWMSPGRRCGGSCWGVRLEELSEHSPFAFTFWDLRTETCHPSKSCAAEVAFSACITPLMRPGNLRRLCQTREFVSSYLRPDAERRQKNGGVILFKKSSANVIPSLTGLIGPHCVGGVSWRLTLSWIGVIFGTLGALRHSWFLLHWW